MAQAARSGGAFGRLGKGRRRTPFQFIQV